MPFDDELVDIGGVGLVEGLEAELVQDEQLETDEPTTSPGTGVDTLSGDGLDDVLEGAAAVVDVTNSSRSRRAGVRASSSGLDTQPPGGHHVRYDAERTTSATAIRPFTVKVPQAEIDELQRRVQATRWPDKETVDDRSQGVQLAKLRPLVEYWGAGYDWRKVDARLNALPQFVTEIDGLDIQFAHRQAHRRARKGTGRHLLRL